jgi:hypothetical protein
MHTDHTRTKYELEDLYTPPVPPEGALPLRLSRHQAALLGPGCYLEAQGRFWVNREGLTRARGNEAFIESMVEHSTHNLSRQDAVRAVAALWDLMVSGGS